MPKLTSLRSEKRLLDRQAADRIRAHILERHPAGRRPPARDAARRGAGGQPRHGARRARAPRQRGAGDAGRLHPLAGLRDHPARRLGDLHPAGRARGAGGAAGRRERRPRGRRRPAGGRSPRWPTAVEERRFEDVADIDFRLHREIVALARHRRLAEQHAHVMQQVRFHMVHAGFFPTDYQALGRGARRADRGGGERRRRARRAAGAHPQRGRGAPARPSAESRPPTARPPDAEETRREERDAFHPGQPDQRPQHRAEARVREVVTREAAASSTARPRWSGSSSTTSARRTGPPAAC